MIYSGEDCKIFVDGVEVVGFVSAEIQLINKDGSVDSSWSDTGEVWVSDLGGTDKDFKYMFNKALEDLSYMMLMSGISTLTGKPIQG